MVNRAQRRAMKQMTGTPPSEDGARDPGRRLNRALVLAWEGKCDCRVCRILQKEATQIFGPYSEDGDDDDDD